MKRLVMLVSTLVLLAPGTATADRASLADPDDTGSQRIWDIRSIEHSHVERNGTKVLRHTITFDDDVSDTNFAQGYNGSGINLYFEFNRENLGDERTAYFDENPDGTVFVAVATKRFGRIRGFANWFQPSPKKLTIEFKRSLLKKGLDHYKWMVEATSWAACEDDGSPASGCPDETRWLRHLQS